MLRLWVVQSGEIIAEWQAHSRAITCLGFQPDGKVLASGGIDAALRLWQIK
jgi:WD40 repeat protein